MHRGLYLSEGVGLYRLPGCLLRLQLIRDQWEYRVAGVLLYPACHPLLALTPVRYPSLAAGLSVLQGSLQPLQSQVDLSPYQAVDRLALGVAHQP